MTQATRYIATQMQADTVYRLALEIADGEELEFAVSDLLHAHVSNLWAWNHGGQRHIIEAACEAAFGNEGEYDPAQDPDHEIEDPEWYDPFDGIDDADLAHYTLDDVKTHIAASVDNYHTATVTRYVERYAPIYYQMVEEAEQNVKTEAQLAEVANVVTTPEAAILLGIKPESVQQNCRRGVYATARQSGGIWIIHRDEVTRHA